MHLLHTSTTQPDAPRIQSDGGSPIDPTIRGASYSRFSSSKQDESSIADQQRKCRESAGANGHVITPELEFTDEAVSGTKLRRAGIDAMLAAARAGLFAVLYVFSLSRLARESVITLPLLKNLVYNYGVRVISVTEGIDSSQTGWDLLAQFLSISHERYISDLAENVLRGQEDAVLAGFSVGDHCFGYGSEPIPGSEARRRGKNAKPRMIYVVDQEAAEWVLRIFDWFVRQRRSLRWIAKELNRLDAPKDHRATTSTWRHQQITKLLQNRKYIGEWAWGRQRNVRNPLTGDIRQEERAPEECEKWVRQFPHLRIIDDETFGEAQRLLGANREILAKSRKKNGTLNGSTRGDTVSHPRHLLSRLIECGHCGRRFNVTGAWGKHLMCPSYAMGTCPCKTQLRRDRAERMILEEIGRRILEDIEWSRRVLDTVRALWRAREATVPSEFASARRRLQEIEKKIGRLVDQVEDGVDIPDLRERLQQRRAEKREWEDTVKRLEAADQNRLPEPTKTWVKDRLRHLGEVLHGDAPAAAHALRALVGGRIVVTEIREPGRKRHYLQGRFTIKTAAVVGQLLGAAKEPGAEAHPDADSLAEEIVIDFKDISKTEVDAERAMELHEQGLMCTEIAQQLGCSKSRLSALLKVGFESRGLAMPDGRSRRGMLRRKHLSPPLYQEVADRVMELYDEGLLLGKIADRLKLDRNTVTAAVRWWHESRGLPAPDGRTRRKQLTNKTANKAKPKAKPKAASAAPTSQDGPRATSA